MNRLSIIAAFFALVSLAGHSALAQSGNDLFQRGLVQERVNGDLDEAIRLYKQIVEDFPDDHALAAKALIQIGQCYEKLGQAEAQKAYQRVIDEYPEQKQEVAIAKERITEISKTLKDVVQRPTFRKIEIASKPQNGILSPDGNKLAFTSNDEVWVVPLHGKVSPDIAGEPVRLAEVPGIGNLGNLMAWSADGGWIAVNTWPDERVHVIPVAGGKPRVIQMPERGVHSWGHRLSLSPDGQMLAFSALELGTREVAPGSHHLYIYTISAAGGEPEQVSSGWGRMPAFSPDGKFIAYVDFSEWEDWPDDTNRSRFQGELWVVPSAGGTPVTLATVDGRLRGPVWSPDGKYIATHHEPGGSNDSKEIFVFPLSADVSSAGEPEKIALTCSSMDMLAGWTPDNELGVFIQTEEHWAIYTVPASGGKAMQITPTSDWPYYPRWSPDGERIYFRGMEENVMTMYVPSAGGDPVEVHVQSERRLVARVPAGGHNVSPDGKRIVVSAYQEPYDPMEGCDIWTIPVSGGRPTRLTSDRSMERYPCWSPDGHWIAFNARHEKSEDEGFDAIYIIPSEGGEIRQITSEADNVGLGAIAFSLDGDRIAFFSGSAIKTIPVEGGESETLISNVKSDTQSQLTYSPDGSKIAHNVEGKIWITPLDGGEPEELQTGLPEDTRLSGFGWSPDGEKIAFVGTTGGEAEFWLVDNFLPNVEEKSMAIRQVWSGTDVDAYGSVSPDGQYLSFTDWETGDLAVRELETGKTRRLTEGKKGGKENFRFALNSVISPDGKQIAYSWTNEHGTYDLCVVSTDGSGDRTLYSSKDHEIYPAVWSPDGRRILARKYRTQGAKEGTSEIVSVSAQGGIVQVLKSFEKSIFWPRLCYSPNGQFVAYDYPVTEDSDNRDIAIINCTDNEQTALIQHPGSDSLLGWVPHRQEMLFLSDREGLLDMWAVKVVHGLRQDSPTVLVRGIGQIQPLGLTEEGTFFFSRNTRTLTTYIVPFDAGTGKISLDAAKPLLGSKDSIKWSPDGRHLACAVEEEGQWHLWIRDMTTGEERELAPHLDVRRPAWSTDGHFILVTAFEYDRRTQEDYHGGIYRIAVQGGEVMKLVAFSPVEEWQRDNWTRATAVWAVKTPEIFYMSHGRIVRRNIDSGHEEVLYWNNNLEETLALSPDGNTLAFGVKEPNDPSERILIMPASGGEPKALCQYNLATWTPDSKYVLYAKLEEKGTTIWRASISGGEPEMLTQSPNIVVSLDIHPNGDEVALSTFYQGSSIWMMENFLPEDKTGE